MAFVEVRALSVPWRLAEKTESSRADPGATKTSQRIGQQIKDIAAPGGDPVLMNFIA